MFSSRSGRHAVERKANKKTGTVCPAPARNEPIWLVRGKVNRVMRFGAFTWGRPKKLPWVEAVATELAVCPPVNAEARKEVRRLKIGGCRGGVTRPSQRLAGCRCGYTRFSATARRPILVFRSNWGPLPGFDARKVGATSDPRYGCAVNTTESASRLIRLHSAPAGRSGLNGWRYCALA